MKLYSDCPVILASPPRAFDNACELGFVEAEVDDLTPEQRWYLHPQLAPCPSCEFGRPTNEREIMGCQKLEARLGTPAADRFARYEPPALRWHLRTARTRRGNLAEGRVGPLCERLTHMLVDRRDRSHGLQASVRMEEFGPVYLLPYSDKRSILARIAEAMVSQQLSSLPRDEALDHVRKGLRELRSAETLTPSRPWRSGGEEWSASGRGSLDRHPQRHGGGPETAAPRDAVEFVHNTLKSWLAGLHSLDANKPRELAARALVSGYDEVIAFAAAAPGHDSSYAKTLIECLLRDAERAHVSVRRSLLILAMRLATLPRRICPRALRVRVKALQDMLFPPKSLDEAQQLATLGDAAVNDSHART